tara:strand:+ start:190 stop:1077 length:888 start_codon:yes stop_codon:yes gene_type:complete
MQGLAKRLQGLTLFSMLAFPTTAFAGFLDGSENCVGLGIGTRPLAKVESGIETYMNDYGYTERYGDMDEHVDLEGYSIPYLDLSVCKYVKGQQFLNKDRLELKLDATVTSSYIFEDQIERNSFPVEHRAFRDYDLGEIDMEWETKLRVYSSLGMGGFYSPMSFKAQRFVFGSGAGLQAGVSYFNAQVVVHLEYDPGKDVVNWIGRFGLITVRDLFEEYSGIAWEEDLSFTMNGYGLYAQPGVQFVIGVEPVFIELKGGYRVERSLVIVDDGKEEKGVVWFNMGGVVGSASLRIEL